MAASFPSSTNSSQQTTTTTSSSNSQQNANSSGQIQQGQNAGVDRTPEIRAVIDRALQGLQPSQHPQQSQLSVQQISLSSSEENRLVNRLNQLRNALRFPNEENIENTEEVFDIFRNLGKNHPSCINFWVDIAISVPIGCRTDFLCMGQRRVRDSIREAFGSSVQSQPRTREETIEIVNLINQRAERGGAMIVYPTANDSNRSSSSGIQQPRPSPIEIMQRAITSYFTQRDQQLGQLFPPSSSQSSTSSSTPSQSTTHWMRRDVPVSRTRGYQVSRVRGYQEQRSLIQPTGSGNNPSIGSFPPSSGPFFSWEAPPASIDPLSNLTPLTLTNSQLSHVSNLTPSNLTHLPLTSRHLSHIPVFNFHPNVTLLGLNNAHPPFGTFAPSSIMSGPNFAEHIAKFRKEAIPDETLQSFDISALEADDDLKPKIARWLQKLTTSTEYLDDKMRPLVCTRVLSSLYFATQNREFLNTTLPEVLDQAVGSCEDDAAKILNELELKKKIVEASDSSLGYLVKLLKGAYKVAKLKEFGIRFVTDKKSKGEYVDDVSVHLGLQVKLKDVLELPVDCQDMNYFEYSRLTSADLVKAKEEVNEAAKNINNLADYFLMEKTWIGRLKTEFSQEFNTALEPIRIEMDALEDLVFACTINEQDYKNRANALGDKCKILEATWVKNKTLELLKS